MLVLAIAALVSFGIGLFAFQNPAGVTLSVGAFSVPNVPIYVVIISSMLSGFLIAAFVSVYNNFNHFMSTRRRENSLKGVREKINNLNLKVQELEAENARLKTSQVKIDDSEEVDIDFDDGEARRRSSMINDFFLTTRRRYSNFF
jgi:uncharacterized integral membrane protein